MSTTRPWYEASTDTDILHIHINIHIQIQIHIIFSTPMHTLIMQ